MAEVKDQAFKLFGKTIQLPNNLHSSTTTSFSSQHMNKEDGLSPKTAVEVIDPSTSCETPETPSVDKEIFSSKISSNEEESETSPQLEKTLKKPDKIVPCPRCTSMDTKFCYYNNYNTNQPRHFCKNCQRYWTSGGATRNVPVGSGRRRNKNLCASHYNRIIVSESQNCVESGFHGHEERNFISCGGKKNGDDDRSSESSITGSNSSEKGQNGDLQEFGVNHFWGFSPRVPCFPRPPYPLGFCQTRPYWAWNMAWISPLPSSPNSPILGKHSRDENIIEKEDQKEASKDENPGRCLYHPKTLRIEDPSEAAKSSIWSTLGIKNEPIFRGGLFKAFQAKGNEKSQISETSLVLQANPAALSRSLNFREIAQ